MATSPNATANQCGVCHKDFDGATRRPHILKCFHTVCTACINHVTSSSKTNTCPFCYQIFDAQSAEDILINESVLELSKYVTFLKSGISLSLQDTDNSESNGSQDAIFKNREIAIQNRVACQESQEQLEMAVHRYTLMKENLLIKHQEFTAMVTDLIGDITAQIQKKTKEIDQVIGELECRMHGVSDKQGQIQKTEELLDAVLQNSEDAAPALWKVHETNKSIQEWHKNLKIIFSNKEIKRDSIQRTDVKMNTVLELLRTCRGISKDTSVIAAMTIQKAPSFEMTAEKLFEMSPGVKCLVGRGKLFAVHREEGGRRMYSKIYITDDNKLCFSCLRDDISPYNAHSLEYTDLMNLLNPTSRCVFLELGVEDLVLGRLYIHFNVNSSLSDQFVLLCTGVKGTSYANTKLLDFFKRRTSWAWVRLGDYENNDGTGGRGILAGQGLADEERRPCLAGTVEPWLGCGAGVAAQFIIHIKDNPKTVSCNCSGVVEEGLEVLIEAVNSYTDIGDVSITDSGIVLLSSCTPSPQ